MASWQVSPLNWPEFTTKPSWVSEREARRIAIGFVAVPPWIGRTTTRMSNLYFLAKSKSRSSCAGTLMIAPVP